MWRTTAVLGLVVALTAGCAATDRIAAGDGAADPAPGGDGPSEAPGGRDDALFVSVEVGGGFVPVGWDFRTVPTAVVYEDGATISPGAVIAIYPGPAVTPLTAGHLDQGALDDLVAAAREAGLLDPAGLDLGEPPVADAPTTTVTVVVGGATHVTSAYALEEGLGALPGLTPAQESARAAVRAFVRQVSDAVLAAEDGPYVPERYRVLPIAPPPVEDGAEAREVDWPFPDLTLAEGRCTAVTGQRAEQLRALLEDADEATRWRTADGSVWGLAVRPVLPHEPDCPS